jgi:hypothetical protein
VTCLPSPRRSSVASRGRGVVRSQVRRRARACPRSVAPRRSCRARNGLPGRGGSRP